jgi:outer membrane receptor for ferrienterochelin and colicins
MRKVLNTRVVAALSGSLTMTWALAQSPPTPPPTPPADAASAPPKAAPPATAPAKAGDPQRIEITGGRDSDTDARRKSTAAKIVIGREEIDKFGDATVGEVLRRLPGVTTPGAPGRGGPPRMRGLGGGFTQLLIDGQRVPPGFSLESLTPEQVERIEILRAPTAETGARAIAGTINIITREGFKRRLNDLRLGFGFENGKFAPGINWTHNDSAGELTYNLSGSVFKPQRKSSGNSRTTVTNINTGVVVEERAGSVNTLEERWGSNLTSRLQWRLNEAGDMLALTPSIFHTEAHSDSKFDLVQALRRPTTPAFYDQGTTVTDSRFTNARLGLQWRQRLGPVRLEMGGTGGAFKSVNDNFRSEFNTGSAVPIRILQDRSTAKENSLNLTLKASGVAGGNAKPTGPGDSPAGAEFAADHSLVAGAEVDLSRRNETRVSLQNGANLLSGFGEDLQASALRVAAYAQDEWNINPNWGAHAGLRWEGITTEGDTGASDAAVSGTGRPSNRSSVWTPLLHAVWKPDPKSRDQVRISLTRSYRSPALSSLIARPTVSRDYPLTGPNIETSPDTAGNPQLKPELATGIDVAVERYLEGGGVLSANLFHRNISNLMRGEVRLETVSYSASPRWVRRQQNIGNATTSGIELEAKLRLDQVIGGSLPIELRGNLSLFDSKVKSVPGPNNRLDQQAKATANIGADYRVRSLPLTLGGNVNWVPGYTTKLEEGQFVTVSAKTVWDAYALWTFSPSVALRLLGSNLVARDYTNTNQVEATNSLVNPAANERTTSLSNGPSYVNWQLRLELKL